MSNLVISDLIMDENFLVELSPEELKRSVCGGAVGAASASVATGIYSRNGDVIDETATTATVAASSKKPFRLYAGYSFKPPSAKAGAYFY